MYLNQDFSRRMDGVKPLRYVDVDDAELADFPALAEAVESRGTLPLVLVGDEVKSPPTISVYWIEDQLAALESAAVAGGAGGTD